MPVGVVLTVPSLWVNAALPSPWAGSISVLAFCLSAYLLAEAAATHEVLGKLRHELLKEEGTTYVSVPRKTVQSA